MVVAKSRWSSVSGVSSSRPLMPMTAFIGVRISWLIVARKALLASLAASAWARGLLRLLEHLRVLDRDHRLVGEGLAAALISLSVNGASGGCADDVRWRRRRGPPSIIGAQQIE